MRFDSLQLMRFSYDTARVFIITIQCLHTYKHNYLPVNVLVVYMALHSGNPLLHSMHTQVATDPKFWVYSHVHGY